MFLRAVFAIVEKDLRMEARTGARLIAMGSFVVLAALLFGFGLDQTAVDPKSLLGTLVWLTIIFATMLGLGRTFELEEEDGAFRYLMLTPVPREAVFLGKAIANLLLVWATTLIAVGAFAAFLGTSWTGSLWGHLAVFFPGTIALVALTTLFSRISSHSRMGSTLLPVLTFPLLVPLVSFASNSTYNLLLGRPWDEVVAMVKLVWAFALGAVFIGASLFRFVAED